MVDLSVIEWLDLAGVFVFASSGALVAARKRLDIFGFVVHSLVNHHGMKYQSIADGEITKPPLPVKRGRNL